jgi:hypothetical protein
MPFEGGLVAGCRQASNGMAVGTYVKESDLIIGVVTPVVHPFEGRVADGGAKRPVCCMLLARRLPANEVVRGV